MQTKTLLYTALAARMLFINCNKHSSTPAKVNYTQISYTGHLLLPEAMFRPHVVVSGNKIIFEGNQLSIYDVPTGKWSTVNDSKFLDLESAQCWAMKFYYTTQAINQYILMI